MSLRLLTLAAATVLVAPATAPASASAVQPPVPCTSLVSLCVGGCNPGDLVRVRLYGHGYADAKCGTASAYCSTSSATGTCTRAAMTLSGSGWIRCLVDPAGSLPAFAVCTVEEPIDR